MSAWKEYKEKLKAVKEAQGDTRPWDMLNKNNYTTEEIAAIRFEICRGCEFLIKATNQCKKCGCFMNMKTKLALAACPVGKWHAVGDEK